MGQFMGLPKMVPTGVGQYFVVRTGKRESRRAVGMWVGRALRDRMGTSGTDLWSSPGVARPPCPPQSPCLQLEARAVLSPPRDCTGSRRSLPPSSLTSCTRACNRTGRLRLGGPRRKTSAPTRPLVGQAGPSCSERWYKLSLALTASRRNPDVLVRSYAPSGDLVAAQSGTGEITLAVFESNTLRRRRRAKLRPRLKGLACGL